MAAVSLGSVFETSLVNRPEQFLTPDLPLHTDILAYVKHLLDPVANEVSTTQQNRLSDARRKRKRGEVSSSDKNVLRIKQIHTKDIGIQQIWEQARRVITATRHEAEIVVSQHEADAAVDATSGSDEDQDESDVGSDDMGSEAAEAVELVEKDLDSDGEITNDALQDGDSDIESDSSGREDDDGNAGQQSEFVQDKFGLNDGFFSIDDFNRQSEFLEQRDTRGEHDGAASDEEDVDWTTNPFSNGSVVALGKAEQANAMQDETDDDGPTFGDADAPSEDDDDEDIAEGDLKIGDMGNTNEVMYTDFFAPPAQKKKKKTKNGAREASDTKSETTTSKQADEQDEDVERTIAAVQRDLFEDEDDEDDSDVGDADGAVPNGEPMSRKSTHERRQAKIAEEIRKLEAANVAKRQWTLSGEAQAKERPMNSLLEEDLDFERAGKPVPVITAEVSESIEELIKRRILAHDFQDIPRRRPDDLATGKDGRRGRLDFDLDDTKSKKALADEYEEEHLRQTDPNFVELKDEQLAKEQQEIESMWKEICSKLDSLSSWHFRPKQPVAQLDIRVDAPTITMEDARPGFGSEIATASQLAPQEIYKAGESSKHNQEEVVGKSGLPARRDELDREEKKSRRRRAKERIRKANANAPTAKRQNNTTHDQARVTKDLQTGGVKVIGKKGNVTDLQGNADSFSTKTHNINAAALKL